MKFSDNSFFESQSAEDEKIAENEGGEEDKHIEDEKDDQDYQDSLNVTDNDNNDRYVTPDVTIKETPLDPNTPFELENSSLFDFSILNTPKISVERYKEESVNLTTLRHRLKSFQEFSEPKVIDSTSQRKLAFSSNSNFICVDLPDIIKCSKYISLPNNFCSLFVFDILHLILFSNRHRITEQSKN